MTPGQQQIGDPISSAESLTLPELAAEVRTLRHEHEVVRERLLEIERRTLGLTEGQQLDLLESLKKVDDMTRQIFSGEITRIQKEDWEVPNDPYFSFRVTDTGNMDEILARYNEWHERLCEVPATVRGMFRLSIDVR
jgi:hypothetical protein